MIYFFRNIYKDKGIYLFMQKRLRIIVKSVNKIVPGLTVSKETYEFFSGCYFQQTHNLTTGMIMFQSGPSIIPKKEDLENYRYEDCRI